MREFECKSADLELCKSLPAVLLNPQTTSDENEKFSSQRTRWGRNVWELFSAFILGWVRVRALHKNTHTHTRIQATRSKPNLSFIFKWVISLEALLARYYVAGKI